MDKIAVVGAGFASRVWAIVFARGGYRVSLFEASQADGTEALRFIRARLQDLRSYGQLPDPEEDVLARISIDLTLEAALDGAIHVQESGADTLEAITELFTRMDEIAGSDAVLASSTSTVFPSKFSEALPGRNRCIVVHPVQPPYALRAVEIVPSRWTSPSVVARSRALVDHCGLVPIMIRREVPGYVINSFQVALVSEAFRLVSEGVASAEDCEAVVKYGLGPRWAFMGPFESGGINAPGGIADSFEKKIDFYSLVRAEQTPTRLTTELIGSVHNELSGIVRQGTPSQRQTWRDLRLMALAEHELKQPR